MNQRTIEFHMIESGELDITVPQYAGVKGEHHATEVAFVLAAGYSADVNAVRLSFNGGDGTVVSTDLLTPLVEGNHARIAYLLPKTITVLGGQLEVRLVLAHVDENGDETVVFCSHAAVLYFDDAVLENGTPFWTGVSQMLKNTVDSVEAARDARDAAEAAREDVDTLRKQAEKACGEAVAAADTAVVKAGEATEASDSAYENATKSFGYARTAQNVAIAAEKSADDALSAAAQVAENAQTAQSAASAASENATKAFGYARNAQNAATAAEAARDEARRIVDAGGASDEQIAQAVENYLAEHPNEDDSNIPITHLEGADTYEKANVFLSDLDSGLYILKGYFCRHHDPDGFADPIIGFATDTRVDIFNNASAAVGEVLSLYRVYSPDSPTVTVYTLTKKSAWEYTLDTETLATTSEVDEKIADRIGFNEREGPWADPEYPKIMREPQWANPRRTELLYNGQSVELLTEDTAYRKEETDAAIAAALANIPTGGGEWRLARAITLEQDVKQIIIDTDDDEKPLNIREFFIEWVNPQSTVNNGAAYFHLYDDKGAVYGQYNPCSISSNTKEQKSLITGIRMCGKILMSGCGDGNVGVNIGEPFRTLTEAIDCGNIIKISISTDSRLYMHTGAVLRLYVKEG